MNHQILLYAQFDHYIPKVHLFSTVINNTLHGNVKFKRYKKGLEQWHSGWAFDLHVLTWAGPKFDPQQPIWFPQTKSDF